MTTPDDATHRDSGGNLYKAGEELNWLRWGNDEWFIYGTVPVGTLHPIKGVPNAAPLPVMPTTAAPMPAPFRPSDALDGWKVEAFTEQIHVERSPFYFLTFIKSYELVGSRITCNPPPLNTDQDVLCLVPDHSLVNMQGAMSLEGYVYEGSAPTDVSEGPQMDSSRVFTSMRKDSMNYILTSDEDFYKRFLAATRLAKKFNLASKADRIALFQAVLYGN